MIHVLVKMSLISHLFHRYDAKEKRISIKLASRLITTTSDLAEILVHEMCHAAVRSIDGVLERKEKHGKNFKGWGQKVMKTFPEITVTRCHHMDVFKKYRYECSMCHKTLHKSLNRLHKVPKRKHCKCGSKILVVRNKRSE